MKKTICYLLFLVINYGGYAQDLELEWVNTYGSIGRDEASSICLDPFGNILITGLYSGSVDFDDSDEEFILTASGTQDRYVQKLDPDGHFIWALSFGVAIGYEGGASIESDSAGNVYLAGTYSNTLIFGDEYASFNLYTYGSEEGFVLKLNSSGEVQWVHRIGGDGYDNADAIAVDDSGSVYIAGAFDGIVDFDPGVEQNILISGDIRDVFALKLDTDGNFLWVRSIGGDAWDDSYSIIARDDYVYVVGDYEDSASFDTGSEVIELISAGYSDVFVLKVESNGAFSWVKSFGGGASDHPTSMTVDSEGNIYITGDLFDTMEFDPSENVFELSPIDFSDSYITKLNAEGNFEWAKSFQVPEFITTRFITVDNEDYVYTAGGFTGEVDFDFGPSTNVLNADGTNDSFIQKIDGEGNFVWVRSMMSNDYVFTESIFIDDLKNVFSCGYFSDSANFNPIDSAFIFISNGLYDSFIQKYDQGICSDLAILYDTISDVACDNLAYVQAHAIGGSGEYQYEWSANPIGQDSILISDTAGIYTLTIVDSNLCTVSSSIIISGPSVELGFDLNANYIAAAFRPGFSNNIELDAYNDGCTEVSGQLKFILDTLVSYDSSSYVPDLISGDTLIWNFENFVYGADHLISQLYLTTDSTALIGDTLCFDLFIGPEMGDLDTLNNHKHYCYPIVNGYDPNDIQVYPQGECDENFVENDRVLSYTIRFQNTGNAEAINIHIIDSLSEYFDLATVKIVASSHAMYTELKGGNVLDFRFDNINLPDSGSDQMGSNGYVIFEISAVEGLNFIEIPNKSEIYFDFNPAIVTNTVYNTMVEVIPPCFEIADEVSEVVKTKEIRIFPNPTAGAFSIDLRGNSDASIKVMNLSGQILYVKDIKQNGIYQFEIDGPSGVYILELSTHDKTEYFKVLKRNGPK